VILLYTSEAQIEEFLREYKRSRIIAETSVRAILKRAVEWEKQFNKAFYEFEKEEALAMFKSAHAISVVSLQNANLTLKHAARYLLQLAGGSIYEEIGKNDLVECVDINKRDGLILSRDDLTDIQNDLLNATDRGILDMLFLGAGGNWLKELTFFSMDQISRKDGAIYFHTGKTISITAEQYEMIKAACDETELISFGSTTRISQVQSEGLYKVRFNALSTNDDPGSEQDKERRFRFIQRRLALISKDLGVSLTSGGLQNSGLLWCLQNAVKESGLTFREYVKTAEAKELARRYDIMSDFYSQILVDKFGKFFS
jgi:hypothetical protein